MATETNIGARPGDARHTMVSQHSMLERGRIVAGRYRVEEPLGEGGFGTVYRAIEVPLNRPVALKLLSRDLVADEALRARFRREADLVQRLGHPNIVRLYDAGCAEDGTPYIALEL